MSILKTTKKIVLSIIVFYCIIIAMHSLYAKELNATLSDNSTGNPNIIKELQNESSESTPQQEIKSDVNESDVNKELEASSIPDQNTIDKLKSVYKDNFDDNFVGKIIYPDWFHTSDFMNYQEDLSEAVEEGKKGAFLLFTTQGCPYCDKFIKLSLGDADIAQQLQKEFMPTGLEIFNDIEMVNFSGEDVVVKDFAKQEGVQFTPTLIFYNEEGKQVFKAIGYQSPQRFKHILNYVAEQHYLTQNLHSYINQNTKNTYKPSMADKLLSGLYEETVAMTIFESNKVDFSPSQQTQPRPLVVLFEEDNCQDCTDFHENILPIKKIRKLLEQFQVVKFNASDNKTVLIKPDKGITTPKKWINELNFQRFPALVFFDKQGRQVLKTDALLRKKRMLYSCQYVLENAFDKGWSYQRFGRFKEGEKRALAEKKKNK